MSRYRKSIQEREPGTGAVAISLASVGNGFISTRWLHPICSTSDRRTKMTYVVQFVLPEPTSVPVVHQRLHQQLLIFGLPSRIIFAVQYFCFFPRPQLSPFGGAGGSFRDLAQAALDANVAAMAADEAILESTG